MRPRRAPKTRSASSSTAMPTGSSFTPTSTAPASTSRVSSRSSKSRPSRDFLDLLQRQVRDPAQRRGRKIDARLAARRAQLQRHDKDGKIAGVGADEIVATMAKSFNMNPALVREMYSQAVDVTGAVSAASVQKDLDFFLQQGWVTGQIKASDVIDMSFAQKASAELGPYQRKSP